MARYDLLLKGGTVIDGQRTPLEVCGNISDALRKKLDKGESTIEYWNHLNGFTR
mgnify:CR=1 FL=1